MNIELKVLDGQFYKKHVEGKGWDKKSIEWYSNLPDYQTSGSVAMDLYATKDYVIAPQERVKIPTGLAVHIGSGNRGETQYERLKFCALIVPRSGLGTKGLVLANTVGIIDEDYQGEIIISAWNSLVFVEQNTSSDSYDYTKRLDTIYIKAGDRIAQMCIVPVIVANWVVVDEFSETTDRGEDGFGSSGK
jgi:dUTP pyrophosphatase